MHIEFNKALDVMRRYLNKIGTYTYIAVETAFNNLVTKDKGFKKGNDVRQHGIDWNLFALQICINASTQQFHNE